MEYSEAYLMKISNIEVVKHIHTIPRHKHNCYIFYYIINGSGTFITDSGTYSVMKQQIIVCFPLEGHSMIPHDEIEYYHVKFEDDQQGDFLYDLLLLKKQQVMNCTENLTSLFYDIHEFVNHNNFYVYKRGVYLFVSLLYKLIAEKFFKREAVTANIVQSVLFSLYSNTNIDIKTISNDLQLSVQTIIKAFKETLGISPKQYILQYKIERATVFLIETNKPIKEIAEELGFSDPYQFSKSFKKHKGIPPKEFRTLYTL